MVEGLRLKEEREYERLAWLIVNIANTCGHLKKPLTIDKLLKKKKGPKKDRRSEIEYLKTRFGG